VGQRPLLYMLLYIDLDVGRVAGLRTAAVAQQAGRDPASSTITLDTWTDVQPHLQHSRHERREPDSLHDAIRRKKKLSSVDHF